MSKASHTELLSDLSLEVFRVTARLNALADKLARQEGLSSARWQVLSALALAGEPLPVAEIARRMGLQRQSVQRTADALQASGHLNFVTNPRHRRAKLATLTDAGEGALQAISALHQRWADGLGHDLSNAELEQARQTLQHFRTLLERDKNTQTNS